MSSSSRPARRRFVAAALLLLLVPGASVPAAAQQRSKYENHVLATAALAGQSVPVLTLGAFAPDEAVGGDTLFAGWRSRAEATVRFDSLFTTFLDDNAPDVRWVPPERLRRAAMRAPGMMPDPDRLGHAALGEFDSKRVPEPLASRFRSLAAVTDARVVLAPASLRLAPDSAAPVRAEVSAVLVDARLNQVLWRTVAIGYGRSPAAALRAAFATMIPPELGL